MSLRHAILTALLERPCTGLELTHRFDRSIGYFWPATHQQVYRELAKLETEQLIESAMLQPPTRGMPKRFAVLPAGREALAGWVATHEEPRDIRDALSVRLRAAAVVGLDSLADQLREHAQFHEARRALYLDIDRRDFGDKELSPEQDLYRLILQAGIGYEEYRLRWVHSALEVVSRIDPQSLPGPDPSPHT
jgi:DNA-binding PadR family transcriptional regulator